MVQPTAEGGPGQVTLVQTGPPLQPLALTAGVLLRAAFRVTPVGVRPVTQTVPVAITHRALPWTDAQRLLISNSPEALPFSKVLFSGKVDFSQPARLLHHHQNGSISRRMTITVALSNPARRPVVLWVAGAIPDPGSDELVLGHEAAHEFLRQYWHHVAGFLLRIPANSTVPLFVHETAGDRERCRTSLPLLTPHGE